MIYEDKEVLVDHSEFSLLPFRFGIAHDKIDIQLTPPPRYHSILMMIIKMNVPEKGGTQDVGAEQYRYSAADISLYNITSSQNIQEKVH